MSLGILYHTFLQQVSFVPLSTSPNGKLTFHSYTESTRRACRPTVGLVLSLELRCINAQLQNLSLAVHRDAGKKALPNAPKVSVFLACCLGGGSRQIAANTQRSLRTHVSPSKTRHVINMVASSLIVVAGMR